MRACAPTWPTRQSAGAPPFLRANAPRVCQLIIFTCQRAIRGPSALTWRAKVPKGMPIFQTLLRELSILYYYIKNSTFYLILQLYIPYVYVWYIKIVLYFISILHVMLKKSVWIFNFFLIFLFFALQFEIKKTCFLYVTSKKGFLKFSTAKITKQNKEYVQILWFS